MPEPRIGGSSELNAWLVEALFDALDMACDNGDHDIAARLIAVLDDIGPRLADARV